MQRREVVKKTFFVTRARFDTLDEAVASANLLHEKGVREIEVDTGVGYGLRECESAGCDAILAYHDEGDICETHLVKEETK
jgi:hypothetical protein